MLFTRTRTQRPALGVTFPVDDVKPAEKGLPMDALSKAFATRSGRAVVAMAERDRAIEDLYALDSRTSF